MTDNRTLDDFVTQTELAEAFSVSERSIGCWRGLPRVRIGRTTFFRKTDVGAWLDRRIEATGRRVNP
jgi:hypothetical protein